jgi:hypothetical protein
MFIAIHDIWHWDHFLDIMDDYHRWRFKVSRTYDFLVLGINGSDEMIAKNYRLFDVVFCFFDQNMTKY